MSTKAALPEWPRTLVVLGRISNLPTVWSNCLAAWLLSGAGLDGRFLVVCAAGSLLYTGGMFLNDAFDAAYDRQHRPERPIPSGRASVPAVWSGGAVLLLAGWMLFWQFGVAAAILSAVLLAAIVVYNACHKRTPLAPALMGACRALLILAGAAAAHGSNYALEPACAMGLYVAGISWLAAGEETSAARSAPGWPIALLFAPALLLLAQGRPHHPVAWGVLLGGIAWTIWMLCTGGSGVVTAISALLTPAGGNVAAAKSGKSAGKDAVGPSEEQGAARLRRRTAPARRGSSPPSPKDGSGAAKEQGPAFAPQGLRRSEARKEAGRDAGAPSVAGAQGRGRRRRALSRAVPGLLAGIALADATATAAVYPWSAPVFVALLVLSLVLQRSIPAT